MGSNSPILFSPTGFAVVAASAAVAVPAVVEHLLFIEVPLDHLETSGPMARHVV
jgi:hypothetical protein